MPLYEYECDACGHRFEVIQKFSDKPVEKCPKCGGAVHKLLSSPAIQFKGTGWYITDYAKKEQVGPGRNRKDPKDTAATKDTTGTGSDAGAKSGASEGGAGSSDTGSATKPDAPSKKK